MHQAIVKLKSAGPMCQGRPMRTPKSRDQTHADWEDKCWKERAHTDNDGYIIIPSFALKNCLSEAAKYKGLKIPGKGNEKYTKNIESGVLVIDSIVLPIRIDDVEKWPNFVPSDGRRGGSKRVWKYFPIIREWEGTATFMILDEIIDEKIFTMFLRDAGLFIGIGSFRVRNNGIFGRFDVIDVKWSEHIS